MSPTAPHVTDPSPTRLLRMREVSARVALRPPRIYNLIKRGDFPVPVRIHGRSVAWIASEVEAWIASRPRAGRLAENTNAPGVTPEASRAHVDA